MKNQRITKYVFQNGLGAVSKMYQPLTNNYGGYGLILKLYQHLLKAIWTIIEDINELQTIKIETSYLNEN